MFENKTRVYFNTNYNFYEITNYLENGYVRLRITNCTDVEDDIIEDVVIFRKDGKQFLRWFFIETDYKPKGDHLKKFDTFEELYNNLYTEEKIVLDEFVDSIKTPKQHCQLLAQLKKLATQTKVNDNWFEDSPYQ